MLPIYVILALAAGVWSVILVLRGSLLSGCLAYLIASCCFGTEFGKIGIAGIDFSLDRILLIGLAGAAVVQWKLGHFELVRFTRIDWILISFVSLLTVSTFTHDWHTDPVFNQHIVQHLINGYWIPTLLYLIARQAPLDHRGSALLLGGLCGFGIYLVLTGFAETAGAWAFVFPRYIADPEIGIHFGRVRGPMVHSVSCGTYLAACMTAAWLWRAHLSTAWQMLVLAAMPLFPVAIYLTKTRSVWMGAATVVLMVVTLTFHGKLRTVLLGGMITAGLLVGLMKMDSIVSLQREGTAKDTRKSANMRPSFAYVSWMMFQDKPVLGFGFGQFAREKLPYLNDRSTGLRLQDIREYVHHNTYLSILTELGLVGLGLFMALHLAWARVGWQLVRDSRAPPWIQAHGLMLLCILGITAWQMLFHDITFMPFDQGMTFLVAAIGVKLRQSITDKEPDESRAYQAAPSDFSDQGDWSAAANRG